MRVVQVSAHYPPNFTSGGTLVPQRIARGLVARGHEVHVYAGHLDDTREDLSTWQEVDDHGVQVRWIATTSWTSWSDDRNWDNPAVEADFRAWLEVVKPDVIHLHSLQTLGGSLVTAAHESGALTVVTMHDFWWFCARQFLVDTELHPCSLVVDCGGCACQVDHQWTVARLTSLAKHLRHADLVLAPSAITARVLVANGVPEDRLRVDENGVPGAGGDAPAAPGRHPARQEDGVRLMFAGGTNPMKGLPILDAALARLPRDVPWTMDLYGVPTGPIRPPQVRSREAFAPAELAAVLAAHDVLVLPSLMRESHSILTREALTAGLAVVCTDTLGPEEAVDHGRNGLVVPAGDPDALATALERLVRDGDEVARLSGQGSASPLRAIEAQVSGLDALYAEMIAARAQRPVEERDVARDEVGLLRQVLFVVGINGAPLRYRVHLAAEALVADGATAVVRSYRDPELPMLAAIADAVVLYRVPATYQVAELVRQVKERDRPVPVLFDVDDLIFDPELRGQVHGLNALSATERDLWWRGVERYRTTMEMADLFVGSTKALCDHAAAVTGLPVRQFRNGVGRSLVASSERALSRLRRPGPLRVGYFSGTMTHDEDWAMIEPAVIEALRARPGVALWVGGHLRTTPALTVLGDRVRRLPMMPWEDLVDVLRDLDVNLAPLVPGSVFNEAKSAIKWLEAAMVETPTVASPTQPFAEAIDQGQTGQLASTHEEWVSAIGRLLDHPLEGRRIGAQARREAMLTLSPHVQGHVYRGILREASTIAAARGQRESDWRPVLEDEPFAAHAAFVESAPRSLGMRRRPALIRTLVAVRRVGRTEGIRGLASRFGEHLRRVSRRRG